MEYGPVRCMYQLKVRMSDEGRIIFEKAQVLEWKNVPSCILKALSVAYENRLNGRNEKLKTFWNKKQKVLNKVWLKKIT